MLYFKNVDVSERFHVSLGTVRNWIDAAAKEKLDLTLYESDGRTYIANTVANIDRMSDLVDKRKKFRNSKAARTVVPKPEFYKLFSEEQIFDITKNLEDYGEIPLQYNYFDGAANSWDAYVKRLAKEDTENSFHAAQELLKTSESMFDSLIADYDRINVVDIGAGNGMPARKVVQYLRDKGKLGRYIAIDISESMLKIAEENFNEWFGDSVAFEGYVKNINHDRFVDLLIPEFTRKNHKKTRTIVLHLGYTFYNLQRPENGYRTIYDSISKNDVLVEDNILDSELSRKYFDFDGKPEKGNLSPLNELILDTLNIDPAYFEVELGFDEHAWQRYEQIRMKVAVDIEIDFKSGKRVISIDKGESILLWRNIHNTPLRVLNQKEELGFSVIYSNQTDSQHYMLTISKKK